MHLAPKVLDGGAILALSLISEDAPVAGLHQFEV